MVKKPKVTSARWWRSAPSPAGRSSASTNARTRSLSKPGRHRGTAPASARRAEAVGYSRRPRGYGRSLRVRGRRRGGERGCPGVTVPSLIMTPRKTSAGATPTPGGQSYSPQPAVQNRRGERVREDGGVRDELGLGESSRRGRLLAGSPGYRVVSREGRDVGVVNHVRYERHSDHPDEIILRRRRTLRKRLRAIPFDAVETVDPRRGTVILRMDSDAVARSPRA